VFTDDGWFRTGDLGSLTADGYLQYAGRSSEMIKRAGINVSPAEVEEVLQQHPDVGLAGVTGAPDARRDEIIVAFVVPRPGVNVDPRRLVEHCRTKLSGYKVPDKIVVSAALPLTATGKLMRRELKAMATDADPKS
jgi:fatty-acyl-CoA synthase